MEPASGLLFMPPPTAARRGSERKSEIVAAGSVQRRHEESGPEADAWRNDTGPAKRILDRWKGYVVRAERDLLRIGCGLVLLDVAAALSACFVPLLTSLLGLARIVGLVVFVPAALRALAIRHADRPDADLMKAIAIALGAAALYFALRTALVVEVCSL
jgi:hypothetical protein